MTKSYWDNPEYFNKRRENIYNDKIGGMSNVDLTKKYGITQVRISQIVRKVRAARLFKGEK